jgi:hypothetical protein
MAKKIHFTAQQENEIALIQEETGMSRKSAIRKLQRRAKLAAKEAAKKAKASKAAKPRSETPRTEPGSARAIGIALYKMAANWSINAYRSRGESPYLTRNSDSRADPKDTTAQSPQRLPLPSGTGT